MRLIRCCRWISLVMIRGALMMLAGARGSASGDYDYPNTGPDFCGQELNIARDRADGARAIL